jgi:hypothetical protein
MVTPTESAESLFKVANENFFSAQAHLRGSKEREGLGAIALGLQQTAGGLRNLSVGVRATYILLEEVKRLLQQQQR